MTILKQTMNSPLESGDCCICQYNKSMKLLSINIITGKHATVIIIVCTWLVRNNDWSINESATEVGVCWVFHLRIFSMSSIMLVSFCLAFLLMWGTQLTSAISCRIVYSCNKEGAKCKAVCFWSHYWYSCSKIWHGYTLGLFLISSRLPGCHSWNSCHTRYPFL